MATYRVSAQISVEGGPWEAYETIVEGADELNTAPPPRELIADIQHHVAAAKGTTAIAVRVREVVVSAAGDPDA